MARIGSAEMTQFRGAVRLLVALAVVAVLGAPAAIHAAQLKQPTFVKIDAITQVGWGENADIVAHLYLLNGQALPDERLTLLIGNDSKQRRTDASGTAVFPIRKNYDPGDYQFTVAFAQTSRYLPSSAAASLSILAPTVKVETVPALPGLSFELDGNRATTGKDGKTAVKFDPKLGTNRHPNATDKVDLSDGVRADFSRWYIPTPSRSFTATYDVYYRIALTFVDLAGHPVDPKRIGPVTLKSSTGAVTTLDKPGEFWVQGSRVVPLSGGLESKDIYYSIQSVDVGGANVVNRSQQKFVPSKGRAWKVSLLFYSAEIHAKDALFGFPMGSGILLQYPDKHVQHFDFGSNASLALTSMPRGDYGVTVVGPGLSFTQPLALSRDQDISLNFLSYLDLVVAFLVVVGFAFVLIAIGRRQFFAVFGGWRSAGGAAERVLISLVIGIVIASGILITPHVVHFDRARTDAAGERSPATLSPLATTTKAKSRDYVVRAGDTLGKIAMRFYGRQEAWQKIYVANKDRIRNPDKLIVGTRLTIP